MGRWYALVIVAIAAACCASVVLAAPLSVGHDVATADGWRATFTFVKSGGAFAQYSGLHLTVLDGSRLVLDEPVASSLRGVGGHLRPGGFYPHPVVSFRDLNADGSKEVLLALFTGGAHCCSIEQVFDFSGAKPRKTEFDFGDSGGTVKVVGGKVVFVGRDDSFAYVFTDYAESGAPLKIWAYDASRFADVTREYPSAISKDAAFWWKEYRSLLKTHGDVRGMLSAWAADEVSLGHAATAKQMLLQIAFNGALDNGIAGATGSSYVRALWRFLAKEGYLR
jgi:hypothetical protein